MSFLPPLLLHYYITERCNCRCSFCDIWKKTPNTPFAKLEDVQNNLLAAKKLGLRFVDFTGGEPLLHKQLPNMLYAAKKLHFRTSVTTNCLLYPEQAEQLAGFINYLHFSLDAMNPNLHNSIRGKKTFDSVMHSLDIAQSLGEKPDILFTVTQKNLYELEPLAAFAQQKKLVLIVNPVFAHSSEHRLVKNDFEYIESFRRQPYVYMNTAFHLLHDNGGNRIDHPRCRVMDSTLVISADNQLLLPCYHFQMHQLPIQPNLNEVVHSQTWENFKERQGKFCFCDGCTLNCYFDPSFQYKIDRYLLKSLMAKTKYVWDKHIRR